MAVGVSRIHAAAQVPLIPNRSRHGDSDVRTPGSQANRPRRGAAELVDPAILEFGLTKES